MADVEQRTDQLREKIRGDLEELLRRPGAVLAIGDRQGELGV